MTALLRAGNPRSFGTHDRGREYRGGWKQENRETKIERDGRRVRKRERESREERRGEVRNHHRAGSRRRKERSAFERARGGESRGAAGVSEIERERGERACAQRMCTGRLASRRSGPAGGRRLRNRAAGIGGSEWSHLSLKVYTRSAAGQARGFP